MEMDEGPFGNRLVSSGSGLGLRTMRFTNREIPDLADLEPSSRHRRRPLEQAARQRRLAVIGRIDPIDVRGGRPVRTRRTTPTHRSVCYQFPLSGKLRTHISQLGV